MTTNYLGIDCGKIGGDETATIICAKRAGKDLKICAIVRESILPKKYDRLSTVHRIFRNISTTYTRG